MTTTAEIVRPAELERVPLPRDPFVTKWNSLVGVGDTDGACALVGEQHGATQVTLEELRDVGAKVGVATNDYALMAPVYSPLMRAVTGSSKPPAAQQQRLYAQLCNPAKGAMAAQQLKAYHRGVAVAFSGEAGRFGIKPGPKRSMTGTLGKKVKTSDFAVLRPDGTMLLGYVSTDKLEAVCNLLTASYKGYRQISLGDRKTIVHSPIATLLRGSSRGARSAHEHRIANIVSPKEAAGIARRRSAPVDTSPQTPADVAEALRRQSDASPGALEFLGSKAVAAPKGYRPAEALRRPDTTRRMAHTAMAIYRVGHLVASTWSGALAIIKDRPVIAAELTDLAANEASELSKHSDAATVVHALSEYAMRHHDDPVRKLGSLALVAAAAPRRGHGVAGAKNIVRGAMLALPAEPTETKPGLRGAWQRKSHQREVEHATVLANRNADAWISLVRAYLKPGNEPPLETLAAGLSNPNTLPTLLWHHRRKELGELWRDVRLVFKRA